MPKVANVWLASQLTGGCCHGSMSRSAAPAQPLPETLLAQFNYSKTFDLASREEPVRHGSRYDIARIEIALPDGFDINRVVTVDYMHHESFEFLRGRFDGKPPRGGPAAAQVHR
jgi:hypothetical protein